MFNLLRKCRLFSKAAVLFHTHQQYMGVLTYPCPDDTCYCLQIAFIDIFPSNQDQIGDSVLHSLVMSLISFH